MRFAPAGQAPPPCTGITYRLKYLDPARMLHRVTQPPHIAGPLGVMYHAPERFKTTTDD
jgi:hypothetical protein